MQRQLELSGLLLNVGSITNLAVSLLSSGVNFTVISWWKEVQEVELLLIACCISSEIWAWITFSHAFSFWEVSEESSWNREDFEGECGIYGKAGCWRQQKVWKGQQWLFSSVSYLKIGSYSQHGLMVEVINCFYTPRLQRRRPKI